MSRSRELPNGLWIVDHWKYGERSWRFRERHHKELDHNWLTETIGEPGVDWVFSMEQSNFNSPAGWYIYFNDASKVMVYKMWAS